MNDANYRKLNDHTHNSSTYHKKDGTPVRAILKEELRSILKEELRREVVRDEEPPTNEEYSRMAHEVFGEDEHGT